MKKFTILSYLLLLGLISLAQNMNHGGQTDSLKQKKTALHKTLTTLQTKIIEQESYIDNDKEIMTRQADSIKIMNNKIIAIQQGYINKSNNLLALIVGIFIFLAFIFLYLRNTLKRKNNEFIKYINETNNILLEQSKMKDKEVTRIVSDLNNANENIKEMKNLINKSSQEK